jgi:hypothetical protein
MEYIGCVGAIVALNELFAEQNYAIKHQLAADVYNANSLQSAN